MADAPVLGGARKTVALDDAAFGARFNGPLLHESVRAELAARRRVPVRQPSVRTST